MATETELCCAVGDCRGEPYIAIVFHAGAVEHYFCRAHDARATGPHKLRSGWKPWQIVEFRYL